MRLDTGRFVVRRFAGEAFSPGTPVTPSPGSDPGSGAFGEVVLALLLGLGLVYMAIVILVAVPTGFYLIARYGPYGWLRDSLIPPAVGLAVHGLLLASTDLGGRVSVLLTLFGFLPTALLLSLLGYLRHRHVR